MLGFGAPHHMSIASCVVRGLATCRFRNQPNSRCRSISRLHEHIGLDLPQSLITRADEVIE
jgi:hypothetical protein